MIDYYNRISNIVATLIVSEPKVRSRSKLLEKIITIAEVCFYFHYNNNNNNGYYYHQYDREPLL